MDADSSARKTDELNYTRTPGQKVCSICIPKRMCGQFSLRPDTQAYIRSRGDGIPEAKVAGGTQLSNLKS